MPGSASSSGPVGWSGGGGVVVVGMVERNYSAAALGDIGKGQSSGDETRVKPCVCGMRAQLVDNFDKMQKNTESRA